MKQITTSNQHKQKAGTLLVPYMSLVSTNKEGEPDVGIVIQTEPSTGIVRDYFNQQPTELQKSTCKKLNRIRC